MITDHSIGTFLIINLQFTFHDGIIGREGWTKEGNARTMLNAAVVGLGWWGRYILNSLLVSDKINLTRAIDINVDIARDLIDKYDVILSDDFQDALDDDDIDFVILATPHSMHEEQVIRVAGAGKHVFCEKPLCLNAASAVRAINACEDAGVQLGIGHERRFEPAMLEIQRMIQAGELGTIMHAESNFSHDKLASVPTGDWRTQAKDAPAAGMTAMGIHLTDAYINLLGPVDELYAQTTKRVLDWEHGDVIGVQLRMKSGVTAYLSAILATPLFIRFQVFGTDAWVEARNPTHPDTPGVTYLTVCKAGDEPETREYAWIDAVRLNFECFAAAINGDAPYINTNEQKLQNVQTLEAICISAAENRPAKVG